ncbi:MAG: FAD-dependent oxidoreductase [Alphaproteobacteria bacterium]|nr:FAD-dependent oxidoreductase [Alphaproteobacteria bacterium]
MTERLSTACCIAGGGPAGMMLGLLLARAGIEVIVLEKHRDFLRDFRGDTVHPSTLTLFHELGLLDKFLALPHEKVRRLTGFVGEDEIALADFSRLHVPAPFIALVPQWDLLSFLAEQAGRYPGFRLIMRAEATGLLRENDRIAGLTATTPGGPLDVRARLTVACDGRSSVLRGKAGLEVENLGAPLDVFWFSLPRLPTDAGDITGRFFPGAIFVQISRGEYWQCAFAIEKGAAGAVRAEGLPGFRARVALAAPFLSDRVDTLADWEQVKLLTVRVDRLRRWRRDGFLCIGDAAHAMSPVGGIGINLAVQDAVAAANLLWKPLVEGRLAEADLARVEARRLWPTRVTQFVQVQAQNRIIAPTLRAGATGAGRPFTAPWIVRNLQRIPFLRDAPAGFVGLGVRPEHIHSPERV